MEQFPNIDIFPRTMKVIRFLGRITGLPEKGYRGEHFVDRVYDNVLNGVVSAAERLSLEEERVEVLSAGWDSEGCYYDRS
jgi:hypothetical protein